MQMRYKIYLQDKNIALHVQVLHATRTHIQVLQTHSKIVPCHPQQPAGRLQDDRQTKLDVLCSTPVSETHTTVPE